MGPATLVWVLLAITAGVGVGSLTVGAYRYGVASERLKWQQHDAEVASDVEKQNAENRRAEQIAQGRVAAAEAASRQALLDLVNYRAAHPLHVELCHKAPDYPAPADSGAGDQRPAEPEAGGVFQSAYPRDLGPDLDLLMSEADQINSAYTVCLSARRVLH